jgi:hypothetical protein
MKKVYGVIAFTLVLSLSVEAFAAGRVQVRLTDKVDLTGPGTPTQSPRVQTGGELVYFNDNASGYFVRFGAGVNGYDDVSTAGIARELVQYTQNIHRRESEPPNFNSVSAVHTNIEGGTFPEVGDEIAGTSCDHADVGPFTTVTCKLGIDSGIILGDLFWIRITADADNGGWLLANEASIGSSEDLMSDDDGVFNFGGCPPVGDLCANGQASVNANVPPPVPTVSEWGLIVIMLLVLTGGTIVLRKARPVTASA